MNFIEFRLLDFRPGSLPFLWPPSYFNESQWFWVDFNWIQWISIDFYEFQWISM